MSLFRIAKELVVRQSYFNPPEGFPEDANLYESNLISQNIDKFNPTESDGDYRISAPRHNFGGQILWALGEEHR